ncbi:MAG TPA: DNA repair protein RecN [Candidatus Krumholzibacteria bacterium]|nr:DNA repair protein RecN [Candidatus Krumholzibacteria bacterium]
MLRRLRIENLAVVEDVTLDFQPGLNVLTGSTGAGKSLIVGAVNLLLGERAPADLIRAGRAEARVEAAFDVFDPAAHPDLVGIDAEAGPVVLGRRVGASGRSSASVNGRAVPLKDLRALAATLVEPHGQNIQYQLRDPGHHVEYLDAFAGNPAERDRYGAALAGYRRAAAVLAQYEAERAAMMEKRELYAHRITDIERVAPRAGEKDDLDAKARVFANAEKLYAALEATCAALYDDDRSAAALVGESERRVTPLAAVDPRIAAIAERLAQAAALLADAAAQARDVIAGLDFDPSDVERTQERLDALVRLERRYGAGVDALIMQKETWKEILATLDGGEGRRAELERAVAIAAGAVAAAGVALTATRVAAAAELDRRVTGGIQSLSMRGAVFRTDIRREPDGASPVRVDGAGVACREDGLDVVHMRVRTNPGEAEGGLDEIASTGELSRVALILKQLAASGAPGTTLIFDEIDAGIGADLGGALAENLLALSNRHQIICITHMPQIAARGQSHLVVQKEIDGDRTRVRVRAAEGDERTREIARMLGGDEGSDRRLALAAEMLDHRRFDRRGKHVRP